ILRPRGGGTRACGAHRGPGRRLAARSFRRTGCLPRPARGLRGDVLHLRDGERRATIRRGSLRDHRMTTTTSETRTRPMHDRGARNLFLVANNIEEVGGLQRVMHTLAAGFAGRGHRVELIGISPGPPGEHITPGPGYTTLT